MDVTREITREEAIANLNMISVAFVEPVTEEQRKLIDDTFDMAIKALEQEPCEDVISRQAVLDLAKKGVLVSNGNYESVCKAINDIPSVNLMPCDGAISRQAAIDACDQSINLFEAVDRLKELPPVTQKSGKWIVHEKPHGIRYLECPYCNIWYLNEHLIRNSYCPNCGARMFEPQESEDEHYIPIQSLTCDDITDIIDES